MHNERADTKHIHAGNFGPNLDNGRNLFFFRPSGHTSPRSYLRTICGNLSRSLSSFLQSAHLMHVLVDPALDVAPSPCEPALVLHLQTAESGHELCSPDLLGYPEPDRVQINPQFPMRAHEQQMQPVLGEQEFD